MLAAVSSIRHVVIIGQRNMSILRRSRGHHVFQQHRRHHAVGVRKRHLGRPARSVLSASQTRISFKHVIVARARANRGQRYSSKRHIGRGDAVLARADSAAFYVRIERLVEYQPETSGMASAVGSIVCEAKSKPNTTRPSACDDSALLCLAGQKYRVK